MSKKREGGYPLNNDAGRHFMIYLDFAKRYYQMVRIDPGNILGVWNNEFGTKVTSQVSVFRGFSHFFFLDNLSTLLGLSAAPSPVAVA